MYNRILHHVLHTSVSRFDCNFSLKRVDQRVPDDDRDARHNNTQYALWTPLSESIFLLCYHYYYRI